MMAAYFIIRLIYLIVYGPAAIIPTLIIAFIIVFTITIAVVIKVKKPAQLALIIPSLMAAAVFYSMFVSESVYRPYFFTMLMTISSVSIVYLQLKIFILFSIVVNATVFVFLVVLERIIYGWTPTDTYLYVTWSFMVFSQIVFYFAIRHVAGSQNKSAQAIEAFNTILTNTKDMLVLVDKFNNITFMSDSMAKAAGLDSAEHAIGKPLLLMFKDPELRDYISDILKTEKNSEEKNVSSGSNDSHYRVNAIKMDGLISTRLITITDVTTIMKSKNEAERASNAKSDFLSKMSHEIRTPMNAILGMSELILREEISDNAREQASTIKHSGIHLLSILNGILDFSKIESGQFELIETAYDLSSVLNDVISIIKIQTASSGLRFLLNISSNIPNKLMGDSVRLHQIILNLLTNGFKYTKNGYVSMTITGEVTGDELLLKIAVKDTGIGIKTEDLPGVFESFKQFDHIVNRGIEGTGLGLPISRNLARLMGGDLIAESVYGEGSTFTVIIPQAIKGTEPLASVESTEDKSFIIFERREAALASYMFSIEDLGFKCKGVRSDEEFLLSMIQDDYKYILMATEAYEEFLKRYPLFYTGARIILINKEGFNNDYSKKDFSIISAPIYCIPIAALLNEAKGLSVTRNVNPISFTASETTILIVDDIATNLKVAEGLLKPYGVKVDAKMSGLEAIKAVKNNDYDLVFMDHMMPEMDGIRATQIIRELKGDKFKKMPIVALTANALVGSNDMFLENGFDDFLSKPIEVGRLDSILARWIPGEKQQKVTGELPDKEPELISRVIQIKDVDVDKGGAFCGGDITSYLATLEVFFNDCRTRIEQLENCIATGDVDLYTTYVHALKSACANIGANKISKNAALLETEARRFNSEFINNHNEGFIESLKALLEDIRESISSYKAAQPAKDPINYKDVKAKLAELKDSMCNFDADGIDEASEALRNFTHAADIGDKIKEILQLSFVGKYREAIFEIETLIDLIVLEPLA